MTGRANPLLDRLRRIRAAAAEARQAEEKAVHAQGPEACEACWLESQEAIDEMFGLILSPEGVAELDVIEARIGGLQ